MVNVTPRPPRFKVQDTFQGTETTIPSGRNWFVVLFMCAWMVGWVFGEVSAIKQLLTPEKGPPMLFMMAWLTVWTLGGLWAVATIAWQLGGREVILIGTSTLQHRVEAFGIGRTRSYQLSEVKNFRAVPQAGPLAGKASWQLPIGRFGALAFDYGARTYNLAAALDEAEANLLVAQLGPRLPRELR